MRRYSDLIYLKKNGYALTLDVFVPTKGNGAGILLPMSGGWQSTHRALEPTDPLSLPADCAHNAQPLLDAGYSVFCIVHGKQPFFTVSDCVEHTLAALDYIRHNGDLFNIDADKLGALGGSSAGHLSLILGVRCHPEIRPLEAVVSFFPPTDLRNYGQVGRSISDHFTALHAGTNPFAGALQVRTYTDGDNRLCIDDTADLQEDLLERLSPASQINEEAAATLLLHGTDDELVPLQQSELVQSLLKQHNRPCELYIKDGGGHGWEVTTEEQTRMCDWFDRHLLKALAI